MTRLTLSPAVHVALGVLLALALMLSAAEAWAQPRPPAQSASQSSFVFSECPLSLALESVNPGRATYSRRLLVG